jgi:nucleoside-diphosphate-sugar epimerase
MSSSESKPILVTGGSGYFGCVVVSKLLARGHRVRVFDLVDNEDRPPEVEFIPGDIRNASAVRRACEGVSIVHHNVAQVPLAKDRELFQTVNVGGARVLFDACKRAGVTKVVNVSSSAIYGIPQRNPVDLLVAPMPREAYGKAKFEGELVAREFISQGLDISTVRPRTILGHGRLGIFQILFELVRLGRPVYVLGGGNNRFQFVHASDLAEICIRAGELAGPDVFLAGAADFGTIRQLITALIEHAKTKSVIRSLPMRPATAMMNLTSKLGLSPLGPYHALMYGREMFFDISKTVEKLGYAPIFGNTQAICESYDDYVGNREQILSRKDASHHRSAAREGILRLMRYVP